VFILEHYFAMKSFTAVREAFFNVYSDKEVPNKTTGNKSSGQRECLCIFEKVVDICCKAVL
jgi:hypothetical protein